jgi:hypothetical protein
MVKNIHPFLPIKLTRLLFFNKTIPTQYLRIHFCLSFLWFFSNFYLILNSIKINQGYLLLLSDNCSNLRFHNYYIKRMAIPRTNSFPFVKVCHIFFLECCKQSILQAITLIHPPTTFGQPTIFKLNFFGPEFKAF